MNILGIDEAGRGSVLGSMFLAGLVCNTKEQSELKKLGVKDSKQFGSGVRAQKQRFNLANQLKKHFDYKIEEITATKIDTYVSRNSLNELEREFACKIINYLKADEILLDGVKIFSPLKKIYNNLVAIDKGEEKSLVIAAASILAKSARDVAMEKLYQEFEQSFGFIKGGGYANKGSLNFVIWHQNQYNKLPCFYRKSYKWKALAKNTIIN